MRTHNLLKMRAYRLFIMRVNSLFKMRVDSVLKPVTKADSLLKIQTGVIVAVQFCNTLVTNCVGVQKYCDVVSILIFFNKS